MVKLLGELVENLAGTCSAHQRYSTRSLEGKSDQVLSSSGCPLGTEDLSSVFLILCVSSEAEYLLFLCYLNYFVLPARGRQAADLIQFVYVVN